MLRSPGWWEKAHRLPQPSSVHLKKPFKSHLPLRDEFLARAASKGLLAAPAAELQHAKPLVPGKLRVRGAELPLVLSLFP